MKREELVEGIIYFVNKYKVYSTIDIDKKITLNLFWNKFNNYIQVEGFDTENIYIRKYIKGIEVKNIAIIKLYNAPYKILSNLYKILLEKFKI